MSWALRAALVWVAIAIVASGCGRPDADAKQFIHTAAAPAATQDFELLACQQKIEQLRQQPALPGAPRFEERRVAIVGRAKGASAVFVKPPPPPRVATERTEDLSIWLHKILRSPFPRARRARLLRGSYLYSELPEEAFLLVDKLYLSHLFDERQIWLQRGEQTHRLKRAYSHEAPYYQYRHLGGPLDGQVAAVLFADRVAVDRGELAEPLHRDLRGLQNRVGFDRIRVGGLYSDGLLAELRFGELWLQAAIRSQGARLELDCLAATASQRQQVRGYLDEQAPYRRSVDALRVAVDGFVNERLPFDHPRHADDHLIDGRLRPNWDRAYFRRRHGFTVGSEGYPVFDRQGRPHPPQTCINMVVDAFERASGTWYQPADEQPERLLGALDFDAAGLTNRAGVLAFEAYAKDHPELFRHRRFRDEERIPFRERERFFGYLIDHVDDFRAGDVVAIRGIKRDGNIHQHAILIEALDPVTGLASDLVDQRSRPRRLTWEGIMREAPARSLFFHLRPSPELLARLDPERARATLAPPREPKR